MVQRFARSVHALQKLLRDASSELRLPLRFGLIGGLALSAWGVVRATEDIDLLADSTPSPIRDMDVRRGMAVFLEERGCKAEWRVGDADDPIPLLLRLRLPRQLGGVGVDILWAHKRWQQEALTQAIEIRVSRMKLSVLHPESLILMKLDAGGPQDLLDVEALLVNPPPELDSRRLAKKAKALRLDSVLRKCSP